MLESDASLIELDLLRGGSRIVPTGTSRRLIDQLKPSPAYVVLVNRAWRRSNAALRLHVYPVGLRDPLPCIWVPLKENEDEILLDLQYVFDRAYDAGPYRRGAVDYAGPGARAGAGRRRRRLGRRADPTLARGQAPGTAEGPKGPSHALAGPHPIPPIARRSSMSLLIEPSTQHCVSTTDGLRLPAFALGAAAPASGR